MDPYLTRNGRHQACSGQNNQPSLNRLAPGQQARLGSGLPQDGYSMMPQHYSTAQYENTSHVNRDGETMDDDRFAHRQSYGPYSYPPGLHRSSATSGATIGIHNSATTRPMVPIFDQLPRNTNDSSSRPSRLGHVTRWPSQPGAYGQVSELLANGDRLTENLQQMQIRGSQGPPRVPQRHAVPSDHVLRRQPPSRQTAIPEHLVDDDTNEEHD